MILVYDINRDLKEMLDQVDLKVTPDLRERRDHQDLSVVKEIRDLQDVMDLLGHPDLQEIPPRDHSSTEAKMRPST